MADLDFLEAFPHGNATITVILPDSTVSRINHVSPTTISEKCPLLYYAFDSSAYGEQQASIEASSVAIVTSFLRYLYTGNYLTCDEESGPCSLLKHVQIYKMARDFDIPELEVAAHVNFLRETETSCSIPTQPADLCDAIRFIYNHLASQQPLLDTLLNYCVSSFSYHGLGADANFRQVAFEVPEFHRALCQTSFKRDFQDEGACEIVRLPVCRSNPRSVVVDKRTHAEFQFEEWYDSETLGFAAGDETITSPVFGPMPTHIKAEDLSILSGLKVETEAQDAGHQAEERSTKRRKTITEPDFTLVHRPKDVEDVFSDSEQSSDEDGFTLVHRPKIPAVSEPGPSTDSSSPSSEPNPFIFDESDPTVQLIKDESDDEAGSDWSLI